MHQLNVEPGVWPRIFDIVNSATLLHRTSSQNADVCCYRVRTPDGDSLVAVKNVRNNNYAVAESLRNEYTALQEVQCRAGDSLHDSVPHPLLLLENEGTIFLTFVSGTPLVRILRRDANVLTGWLNPITAPRLQKSAHLIGEWLKTFHRATKAQDSTHDPDDYACELARRISKCEPFGLSPSVLGRVQRVALGISASLRGHLIPMAAMHGDFVPQNILLHKGRPGVIDFASYRREAPIYCDLAFFISYVLILSRKPLYSRRTLESFAENFLLGYGFKPHAELLRLHLIRACVRILSDGNPERSGTTEGVEELLLGLVDEDLSRVLPTGQLST